MLFESQDESWIFMCVELKEVPILQVRNILTDKSAGERLARRPQCNDRYSNIEQMKTLRR